MAAIEAHFILLASLITKSLTAFAILSNVAPSREVVQNPLWSLCVDFAALEVRAHK